MELRQLQTFREVAAQLSFTRAAERLDYAQSSVTAQIQALEEELGVSLFDRLGKRVVLTDAGQRLRLASEARQAVRDDGEPCGTLSIGAPESLCAYRLPTVRDRGDGRDLPAVAVGAELAGRRLVAMPWAGGDYGLFTQMAGHRDKRRSPAFDAFVALARQMLAER